MTSFPFWLYLIPCALGFVAPVPSMISEILSNRRPNSEITIRHRFHPDGGHSEIEERMVRFSGTTLFLLKSGESFVALRRNKDSYYQGTSLRIGAKSSLFNLYLLSTSAQELLQQLLSENFIRRDHLLQFRERFEPVGDPKYWEVNQHYIRHEDIFFHRLDRGVSVAVLGEPPDARRIYFDPKLRGIMRIEWQNGGEKYAWNFSDFVKFSGEAHYPKQLSFEAHEVTRIQSEVISIRPAKLSPYYEALLAKGSMGSVSSDLENNLRTLLTFR